MSRPKLKPLFSAAYDAYLSIYPPASNFDQLANHAKSWVGYVDTRTHNQKILHKLVEQIVENGDEQNPSYFLRSFLDLKDEGYDLHFNNLSRILKICANLALEFSQHIKEQHLTKTSFSFLSELTSLKKALPNHHFYIQLEKFFDEMESYKDELIKTENIKNLSHAHAVYAQDLAQDLIKDLNQELQLRATIDKLTTELINERQQHQIIKEGQTTQNKKIASYNQYRLIAYITTNQDKLLLQQ